MIRALLPHLVTALVAVILRDVWITCAARVWSWRKRRQSQRDAAQTRELRALAMQYSLKQVIEEERIKRVLNPQLLNGRRAIRARNDKEFLLITERLHENFRAQGKAIFAADFEEN